VIGLVVNIYADGRGGKANFQTFCHEISDQSPNSSICLSRRSMRCRTAIPLLLQAGELLF